MLVSVRFCDCIATAIFLTDVVLHTCGTQLFSLSVCTLNKETLYLQIFINLLVGLAAGNLTMDITVHIFINENFNYFS